MTGINLRNLTLEQLIALITALTPLIENGAVGIAHIIAAIRAVVPDAQIDDDLRALVGEALMAKAEADLAASGHDPQ